MAGQLVITAPFKSKGWFLSCKKVFFPHYTSVDYLNMITGWPAVPLWFHFWRNNLFFVRFGLWNPSMYWCRNAHTDCYREWCLISLHTKAVYWSTCAHMFFCENVCVWSGLYTVMTVVHLIAVAWELWKPFWLSPTSTVGECVTHAQHRFMMNWFV